MRLRDLSLAGGVAALVAAPALGLDFSAELQQRDAGEVVKHVELGNGASMHVTVRNDGEGPDIAIVFDSADPTADQDDLGTPNEDFGGPGVGDGGESGQEGKNDDELGNVLVIAADDRDRDDDDAVDEPEAEEEGGIVWLRFSHAGRLSFTLIDVDEDEAAPRIQMYLNGEAIGDVRGESLGDNSAQSIELPRDVDAVAIYLDGTAAIGDIDLDVPVVDVQPQTWSGVKRQYR